MERVTAIARRGLPLCAALLALGTALPADAGDPPEPARSLDLRLRSPLGVSTFFALQQPGSTRADATPAFRLGRVEIGLQGLSVDQDSSTFREYRVLPEGFVVPYARALSRGTLPYDLRIQNGGRDDARYELALEPGPLLISAAYQRAPHRFTNGALSILAPSGAALIAPASVQAQNQAALVRQFQANAGGVDGRLLTALANASLPQGTPLDVRLLRERGRVDLRLGSGKDWDARASYAHENRDGSRVAGASFGYQNVVEIAEPIRYRTDDVSGSLEWKPRFGLVRGSLQYSRFANELQSVTFQNPFRATDSTALNAIFGPSVFGVDGPREGRIALPPDNQALRGSLGFLVELPGRSRLNADVALGEWKQDSAFIPYSTNSAITTPLRASELSALPGASLDGRMRTFSQSYSFSSRPIEGLVLTARYRSYELTNDTPRVTVPGEAYYDGVWNYNARISVPYAYTKVRLFAAAAYEWGPASLEAGFSHEGSDRAFRETRRTSEGIFHVKADVHAGSLALLRALAQWGSRDYDLYLPRAGESSSYPNGKPPTLLSELRRYDQAKRDSLRYGGELLLTPANASILVSFLKGDEDYYATLYGLRKAGSEVISAEADYSPGERLSLFGYATRENLSSLARGAQRGPTGAPSLASEWTSDVRDRVYSLGLGATLTLVKERADLRLQAGYQKVDGNNDLTAPGGASDIPDFDDTRLRSVNAEISYKPKPHWVVALGGSVEDFEIVDSSRSGLSPYVPGGFFLVGSFEGYNAKIVYLKLRYGW